MTTTLRIALLAGLLALVSNLAVLGFIYLRTHDATTNTLRHEVIEQGAVLADVYRTGGMPALRGAIADTVNYGEDAETAVGLFDRNGRPIAGNLANLPRSEQPLQEGYRSGLLRFEDSTTPQEAALAIHRLPTGDWLVSGRASPQGLALRNTLERSLLIAIVLALLLGLVCGFILAQYVGQRVRSIVAVTGRITGSDLTRRIPLSGADDPFDRLGLQINEMLDRIANLMQEVRIVTDTLAHDLRSPVSRLRSAAQAAAETSDPARRDQALASIIRQADSLMRILTTVLEISRSRAMTGREQFSWFDADELAAELCEMYEPVAEDSGVAFRFDRPLHADADVRPPPVDRPGGQQSHRECDSLRFGRRRDPAACRPGRKAAHHRRRRPWAGHPGGSARGSHAALRPARFQPLRGRCRAWPRAGARDRPSARRRVQTGR